MGGIGINMLWDKSMRTMRDPNKLKNLASKPQLKLWTVAVVVLGFIYFLMSDGDFSFLLTLSSLVQCFAFISIVMQFLSNEDQLSRVTFIIYSLGITGRLTSILFYEGYLPYDRTGDWFY